MELQEIAIKFKEACSSIRQRIHASPYKLMYIIHKMGMPNPTFYDKLRNNRWTPDELIKLSGILQ